MNGVTNTNLFLDYTYRHDTISYLDVELNIGERMATDHNNPKYYLHSVPKLTDDGH